MGFNEFLKLDFRKQIHARHERNQALGGENQSCLPGD